MKLVLVLMCFLTGSLALPSLNTASAEWKKFKELNKKIYKNVAEELMRLKIYLANKVEILAHNLKFKIRKTTFQVEMNKFGDLLQHEFTDIFTGFKAEVGRKTRALNTYVNSGKPLPPYVDWRQYNYVNVPKEQGECGSCWSFSATGAIEAHFARKTGQLIALSQQNMVDCSLLNYGCKGGRTGVAFDFVRAQGGINPESVYPYTGVQGPCRFNPSYATAQVAYYMDIQQGNDYDLADAIANVGPVSVSIDARSNLFRFYKSGIFSASPTECTTYNLTHAVLAIGYGVENGYAYWTIKNSWGTQWGEGGFVRIYYTGQNLCGVSSAANFPVLQ